MKYDLVIIGAGPAGLTLARELKNSNLGILLLDKKKSARDVQYYSSGSFINPAEWGLPRSVLHPICSVNFSSRNKKASRRGFGYVIKREKLMSFLEEDARKNENLHIAYGATVKNAEFSSGGVKSLTYLKDGEEVKVSGKIFVDCSGISAILGKKAGLAPKNPILALGMEYLVPLKHDPHTADFFMGKNLLGGYGWVFPKDEGTAIVGVGTLLKECFPKIESMLKDMWKIDRVRSRCELKPIKKSMAGFRTGKPLKKFTWKNLLIIGDSGLQASPLAGEGIRFVMDSARMAAKWIRKVLDEGDLCILHNYDKEWKKKYYRKFKLAFYIQRKLVYISRSNKLTDMGVGKLDKVSDNDFGRLLGSDVSRWFLFKLALKVIFLRRHSSVGRAYPW